MSLIYSFVSEYKLVLQAFAQTFSRNLTLTYDLSKRTVLYKVAEKRLEKILGAVQQQQPPFTPAQVITANVDVFLSLNT